MRDGRERRPWLRCVAAGMVLVWTGTSAPEQAFAAAPKTVRCESSSRETVQCKADTRGGVTLQRQLSRAGCWYDETWGFDSRGIWVSNGCRADFALGQTGSSHSSTPKPGTSGQGLTGNDAAAAAAAALVIGAIAAAAIASNKNDDDDDRYDYGGCARRDSRGRCIQSGVDPWQRDQVVRCESQGYKERYCRVNTRRGVELYRQRSKTRCRYRSNWGYDRKGIWVDKGCAADFVIRG